MKRLFSVEYLIAALVISFFALLAPLQAFADDPKARQIMNKVNDRDDGDNSVSDMEMTLIDKRGKKRVRRIASYSKDFGDDIYKLLFFIKPADVKNTGFLTYDYDSEEKSDDQWLYLPALKKTKRIASDDKSGSFMGSDFNYYDMTKRQLDDYDYRLVKETMVKNVKTWLIEAIPRRKEIIEESGYKKTLIFVRQDNYVAIRAVNFMKKGGRLKYMEVRKLEFIDNVWVATETWMTTKKGKSTLHKTILKQLNIRFNQNLDKEMFTVRRLEKGL
jgi:hypothetical protein